MKMYMYIVTLISSGVLMNLCQATKLTYTNGCPVLSTSTCPDNKYVFFRLFTRTNPSKPQTINLMTSDNLLATNFNASNPTKIIFHGFMGNFTHPDLLNVKSEYLARGQHNIILVDWSILATGPGSCYLAICNNAPYVAACAAGLIQRLRTASAGSNTHVIGVSLGAQVAGYLGAMMKPEYLLPRITGLDPAGMNFETLDNTQRLDSTDAIFVDILHTNVNSIGIAAPTGHVDAYFNGGTNQPGCLLTDQICSHMRALKYFAKSINSYKGFWGWKCTNFALYYKGLCPATTRTVLVGDKVNPTSARGIVSVPTKSWSPFALGK